MHRPASLEPGEPSFIGLPATTEDLRDFPKRVIFSLKSWIGRSSGKVALGEPVLFAERGKEQRSNLLPLREVAISGFAALADAYIRRHRNIAPGRIIITHPNTFTRLQRDTLRHIAFAALHQRFDVSLSERIVLMSESDAVAYSYLQDRFTIGIRRRGTENLLIYDLGGGTLDLSIIRVVWSDGAAPYPTEWRTLYRLGVPIAGNHLDGAIARMVHDEITGILAADDYKGIGIEYRYPLVGDALRAREADDHELATRRLWLAIRAAKQGQDGMPAWDGSAPFVVTVAEPGRAAPWPLMVEASDQAVERVRDRLRHPVPTDSSRLAYWYGRRDEDLTVRPDRIQLSVPAEQVHRHAAIREYVGFITGDVIDAALQGAELKPEDVHTVVISGRGALWPRLRATVEQKFPAAEFPRDLDEEAGTMKEAVVRGAISRQSLQLPPDPEAQPRLAVLLEPSGVYVPEDAWGDGIDLTGSESFRLVEVAHSQPDPARDMQSLRRHFYFDVGSEHYRVAAGWQRDPILRIRREVTQDGDVVIRLGNRVNPDIAVLTPAGDTSGEAVRPPWPIGNALLPPLRSTTRPRG
jgi:hypothetical protein